MRKKKKAGRKKLPKSLKKRPFSMKLPPSLLRRLVLNSKKVGMKSVTIAEKAIEKEMDWMEEDPLREYCNA